MQDINLRWDNNHRTRGINVPNSTQFLTDNRCNLTIQQQLVDPQFLRLLISFKEWIEFCKIKEIQVVNSNRRVVVANTGIIFRHQIHNMWHQHIASISSVAMDQMAKLYRRRAHNLRWTNTIYWWIKTQTMRVKILTSALQFSQSTNLLTIKMKTIHIYTITVPTSSLNTVIIKWPHMLMPSSKCSCKTNKLQ